MTRTEYFHQLNEAKGAGPWKHQDGASRIDIGELAIELRYNPKITTWELLDAGGNTVLTGNCQTLELARAEAILYAEDYVKKVVDPAYSQPA
jgi:hypothetical protein